MIANPVARFGSGYPGIRRMDFWMKKMQIEDRVVPILKVVYQSFFHKKLKGTYVVVAFLNSDGLCTYWMGQSIVV